MCGQPLRENSERLAREEEGREEALSLQRENFPRIPRDWNGRKEWKGKERLAAKEGGGERIVGRGLKRNFVDGLRDA